MVVVEGEGKCYDNEVRASEEGRRQGSNADSRYCFSLVLGGCPLGPMVF